MTIQCAFLIIIWSSNCSQANICNALNPEFNSIVNGSEHLNNLTPDYYFVQADIFRLAYKYFLDVSLIYIQAEFESHGSEATGIKQRLNAFNNLDSVGSNHFPVSWFNSPMDIPDCGRINNQRQQSVCIIFSYTRNETEQIDAAEITRHMQQLNSTGRAAMIEEIRNNSDASSLDKTLSSWADELHAGWIGNKLLARASALNLADGVVESTEIRAAFGLRNLEYFNQNSYQGSDVILQMISRIGSVFAESNSCTLTGSDKVREILSGYQAIGLSFAVGFALQYCNAEVMREMFLPSLEQHFNSMLQRRQFTINQRQTMLHSIFLLDQRRAADLFRNHIQRIDALDQTQNDQLAAVLFSALNLYQENADMRSDARSILERLLRSKPELNALFLVLQLATLPPDDVPNQLIRYEQ